MHWASKRWILAWTNADAAAVSNWPWRLRSKDNPKPHLFKDQKRLTTNWTSSWWLLDLSCTAFPLSNLWIYYNRLKDYNNNQFAKHFIPFASSIPPPNILNTRLMEQNPIGARSARILDTALYIILNCESESESIPRHKSICRLKVEHYVWLAWVRV